MDIATSGDADQAAALLPEADVLVLSANAPEFGRERFQKALNAFADAGKGIVPLHAGVWHNWPKETGYNSRFVGGGARGHGAGIVTTRLGDKPHPVLAGLPPTFAFWDESYHVELEPGAPVTVLAINDPDN
jgi:type 1 glutamine amidotransferase